MRIEDSYGAWVRGCVCVYGDSFAVRVEQLEVVL